VADRRCRCHSKEESGLERNTNTAESEKLGGEGKREVKLLATTGFLVLKHGPNTMLNIITQLVGTYRGDWGDSRHHKLKIPHQNQTPMKNTTTEVFCLSLKELE